MLDVTVWTTAPAFSTSIFTFDPPSPEDVQVIVWVEPRTQDSPPLGELTAIEGEVVVEVMAKLLLLESVIAVFAVLVIRIL